LGVNGLFFAQMGGRPVAFDATTPMLSPEHLFGCATKVFKTIDVAFVRKM